MMTFFVLVLSLIFFQDLKERSVYWFLFLFVFIISLLRMDIENSFTNMIKNLPSLFILLLLLSTYISLRKRRMINIWNGYFSIGDIVFLAVITPNFSTLNYFLFISVSCIFSLLVHLLVVLLIRKQNSTIPYAGHSSLLMIGLISTENMILCQ